MARAIVLFLLVVAIVYSAAIPHESESFSKDCGPNEVFNACGSACQPKCNEDPVPICTMMCRIGCQCKEGYVRNKDDICVLTRDC